MADLDDTLIDMPLLEEVLDNDDDDDDGDNDDSVSNKGLDKLKLSDPPLTADCDNDNDGGDSHNDNSGGDCHNDNDGGDSHNDNSGGEDDNDNAGCHGDGDSDKPVVVCPRNSGIGGSGKTADDDVTCEPGVDCQSESQTDSVDETSSSSSSSSVCGSSNNNNNNIDSNSSLKDEACLLSTSCPTSTPNPTSTTTTTTTTTNTPSAKDGDTVASRNTGDYVNEVTSPLFSTHTSLYSPLPSSTTSTTNSSTIPQEQQQQQQQPLTQSTDSLDDIPSDSLNSGHPEEPSRQLSTSSSTTRAGSTSSRLLSSDSDFNCSQDSIVTVEVIAIPPLVDFGRDPREQSSVSADDRDSDRLEESEEQQQIQQEPQQQQSQEEQQQQEETATSAVEAGEEREEEEVVNCVETEVVEMSDQQKLEEKLRQFENDAKERGDDPDRNTDGTVQMSESEKQRRRNLIFDEERFEETFLKCLICREVYNETDKLPKMLHCHHTFCMDCLYQMYRVEGEFRQSLTSVFRNMPLTVKIQCPTCRDGIIISEAELRRLPNDHTIMELLCFVNKTGKNDVQYCPKHQMQPLNFFCEPCIMPVCCDCTVLDHKESKGHRVVNVDEAMKKYTPIVEDTLNDIRKEKTTLAGKRDALENTREDLNRIQSGISDQIRKVFDSIREVLDERERELHDVAISEVDRKQGVIEGHLNTIADRESDLNAEFNSLQLATDDRDISLIFTGHKSARDLLARKVFIPTNSTAGFSITFQFSSRADTVIKQQVANLGDVIFHS